MSKGKIKNLQGHPVPIRHLGWCMPALNEDIIDDTFPYDTMKASEEELVAAIVAGDIEILDSNDTVVASDAVGNWLATAWSIDRDLTQGHRIEAVFNTPVPTTGSLFLSHSAESPHTEVGFGIDLPSCLRRIYIAIDQTEPNNTYDVRIYRNPTLDTPTLCISGKLAITPGSNRVFQIDQLADCSLEAGEYGIAIERTSGSGESSFVSGAALLVIEEQ